MSRQTKVKMRAVLNYINEYNAEYGYAPSIREICSKLEIKSTASAYMYLQKLKDEGYLNRTPNRNRALSFKKSTSVNIPLIGTVTAGQPILHMKITKIFIPSLREVFRVAIYLCCGCKAPA